MLEQINDYFAQISSGEASADTLLVYRLVVSLIIYFVIWITKKLMLRVIESKIEDQKIKYHWSKVLNYIAYVLAFILIGRLWLEGIQSIATFLGLLSAGIAISLKDILQIWLAGFSLFLVAPLKWVIGWR